MDKKTIINNNNRRSRIDRRTFSYTEHSPERRLGKDRRFMSNYTDEMRLLGACSVRINHVT